MTEEKELTTIQHEARKVAAKSSRESADGNSVVKEKILIVDGKRVKRMTLANGKIKQIFLGKAEGKRG